VSEFVSSFGGQFIVGTGAQSPRPLAGAALPAILL
jgi:hypothetical protein